MAASVATRVAAARNLTDCRRYLVMTNLTRRVSTLLVQQPTIQTSCQESQKSAWGQHQPVRHGSFFVTLSADQIWKGVTSVSNAGKKRGRGKGIGKIVAKDLNRGQVIGVGYKRNMVWPGLNAPIVKGKEVVTMKELPLDPEREAKLIKIRDSMSGFRSIKLSPLERGWSGSRPGGRSIGPPDPVGDDTFQGFDTKVLEFKTVTNMSGVAGRVKSLSAFVVTGNGNGLAGFALGKAPDARAAFRRAKNRAAQQLSYVERYDGHTVFHNFYAKYGRTKIFVKKKPRGYGLVCHRVLKTICETIGITDMYAKVEGNTKNTKNLTKAFFLGLLEQKTHQSMADETGFNVVEFRKEKDYYPTLVAAPSIKKNTEDKTSVKKIDYDQYLSEGRVELKKKKWPPFYVGTWGWENHQKRTLYQRNFEAVKIKLKVEYGGLKSHLTDKSLDQLPVIKGVAARTKYYIPPK